MKKYKIIDIHPADAFYENKDEIIGKVWELDLDDIEHIYGWRGSRRIPNQVHPNSYNDYSNREFYAIKVEEVE